MRLDATIIIIIIFIFIMGFFKTIRYFNNRLVHQKNPWHLTTAGVQPIKEMENSGWGRFLTFRLLPGECSPKDEPGHLLLFLGDRRGFSSLLHVLPELEDAFGYLCDGSRHDTEHHAALRLREILDVALHGFLDGLEVTECVVERHPFCWFELFFHFCILYLIAFSRKVAHLS